MLGTKYHIFVPITFSWWVSGIRCWELGNLGGWVLDYCTSLVGRARDKVAGLLRTSCSTLGNQARVSFSFTLFFIYISPNQLSWP